MHDYQPSERMATGRQVVAGWITWLAFLGLLMIGPQIWHELRTVLPAAEAATVNPHARRNLWHDSGAPTLLHYIAHGGHFGGGNRGGGHFAGHEGFHGRAFAHHAIRPERHDFRDVHRPALREDFLFGNDIDCGEGGYAPPYPYPNGYGDPYGNPYRQPYVSCP